MSTSLPVMTLLPIYSKSNPCNPFICWYKWYILQTLNHSLFRICAKQISEGQMDRKRNNRKTCSRGLTILHLIDFSEKIYNVIHVHGKPWCVLWCCDSPFAVTHSRLHTEPQPVEPSFLDGSFSMYGWQNLFRRERTWHVVILMKQSKIKSN